MKFKIDSMLMIAGCLVIICFLAKPAWEQVAFATGCTSAASTGPGCTGPSLPAPCGCGATVTQYEYSGAFLGAVVSGSGKVGTAKVNCSTAKACVYSHTSSNWTCAGMGFSCWTPEIGVDCDTYIRGTPYIVEADTYYSMACDEG